MGSLISLVVSCAVAMSSTALVNIDKSHSGVVVSATAGKLVMSDADGKNEHSHEVTDLAKVTLNGMPAALPTLQAGDAVTITMDPEGKVVGISAKRMALPK